MPTSDRQIVCISGKLETFVTHSIERPYGVYPWFDFALVVEVDDFQEGRLYTVGFSHGSDLEYKTHRVAGVALVVT